MAFLPTGGYDVPVDSADVAHLKILLNPYWASGDVRQGIKPDFLKKNHFIIYNIVNTYETLNSLELRDQCYQR